MRSESCKRRPRPGAPTARAAWALVALSLIADPQPIRAQGQANVVAPTSTSPSRAWKDDKVLRVCADPDNLPFSNRKAEGFDNRIATLFAQELGDSLAYVWWPQRRGFVRNTLRAGDCDVIIGVPGGFDPVLETKPYYRSTYYLVYPTGRQLALTSLDDPALRRLKIGVNLIGEDYTHPPPVHALLKRGISSNVTGFSTFYGGEHHPGEIIEALGKGDIDVAIAWGPLAGYFAKQSSTPLTLVPLPDDTTSGLPFAFDVGVGVRRADKELRGRLDDILERRRPDIQRILREYDVPTVSGTASAQRIAVAAVAPASIVPAVSSSAARSQPDTSEKKPAKKAAPPEQPPAPTAVDRLAVTQSEYNGWKAFAVNCTRCHGEDAIGSSIAPSLLKSLQESVTRDVFIQTVTNGRPEKGMPPWSTLLTARQVEDLYAYVKARSEGRLAVGRPHVKPGG